MKLDKSAFVSDESLEVIVQVSGKPLTLYVKELSYLRIMDIYANKKEGSSSLACLIAASISDKDGNQFTIEEAMNLKKEIAEPLIEAVLKINSLSGAEKN